jgi:tRNA threonylcarbamoyladenosine biosynthesis protein TsaB
MTGLHMKILALDTSTSHLTIAVLDGEKVLATFHEKVDRNHSSMLIPMIDKTLKIAKTKLKSIGGFCIGVGPGSFTGLRIGVATIKGLAYPSGKPIVAVPTFDAVARNVTGYEGVICPVLDARKNKVYAALYESGKKGIRKLSEYLLVPASELMKIAGKYDKIFFIGDGVKIIGRPENEAFDWHPRAEVLGKLALESFAKKKFTSPEKLEPMYLYSRECDITGR